MCNVLFSFFVVVHMLPIYIHVFFVGLLFICCIYMHDFIIFLGGITTMFARLLMILHFFLEHMPRWVYSEKAK